MYAVLKLEPGVDALVRVKERSGEPVVGAEVWANVSREDGESAWVGPGTTDSEGLARVEGVPRETFHLWIDTDEHALVEPGPYEILEGEEESEILVVLDPAGAINGRVTHQGEPVTDFHVSHWRDDPWDSETIEYSDVEDGSFEVADVAVGVHHIAAWADGTAESEPLRLEVAQGSAAEVSIELPPSALGVGTVVDATSLDPIGDARVQLWATVGETMYAPRSTWSPCDDLGEFSIDGLQPGTCRILVSAPGYMEFTATGNYDGQGRVDFGLVAMRRARTLRFLVNGLPPTQVARARISAVGCVALDPTPVREDGELVVPRCRPGFVSTVLELPDGSVVRRIDELLETDDDWTVEFDLSLGSGLNVVVEGLAESGLSSEASISVTYTDAQGRASVKAAALPAGGSAVEFRGIDAERVTVCLLDKGRGSVDATSILLSPGSTADVVLRADRSRDGVSYLVVDSGGQPVPGVELGVSGVADPLGWHARLWTDEDGLAVVGACAFDDVYVLVGRAGETWYETRITDLVTGEPNVLALSTDHRVRIALHDDGEPVAGKRVLLAAAGSGRPHRYRTTDANGVAQWNELGAGEFLVQIEQVGLESSEHLVHSSRSDEVQRLEVHRLVDVRVVLLDDSESPVAGMEVVLRSDDRGTTESAVTDDSGMATFPNRPRGRYDWAAVRDGVSISGGQLEVAPDRTSEFVLRIGP